jgi:putative Mg2+ transporter-C (MgtC) family protein
VRLSLLQSLNASNITLRSLQSENFNDTTDKVKVEAGMITQNRDDQLLEQIASRLSLQRGVVSVSWRILEEEFG